MDGGQRKCEGAETASVAYFEQTFGFEQRKNPSATKLRFNRLSWFSLEAFVGTGGIREKTSQNPSRQQVVGGRLRAAVCVHASARLAPV